MQHLEELISKKDLLLDTGISYGQLYRWKRQNLIPDAWFMKQSSFTGQETYFPKRKVIDRVMAILSMKDTHSLEDMAELFSQVSVNKTYLLLDVMDVIDLQSSVADLCLQIWEKNRFTLQELLFIELYNDLELDIGLTQEEKKEWLITAKRWAQELTRTDIQVLIYRKRSMLLYMLLDVPCQFHLDEDSQLVTTYDLSERSKYLNVKLQQMVEG